MRSAGQLAAASEGVTGERGCGETRNLDAVTLKDARFEETRGSIAGKLQDAGYGVTRRPIAGLNGTMIGSSNLRVHSIETPGTSVSGVFVCGGYLYLQGRGVDGNPEKNKAAE